MQNTHPFVGGCKARRGAASFRSLLLSHACGWRWAMACAVSIGSRRLNPPASRGLGAIRSAAETASPHSARGVERTERQVRPVATPRSSGLLRVRQAPAEERDHLGVEIFMECGSVEARCVDADFGRQLARSAGQGARSRNAGNSARRGSRASSAARPRRPSRSRRHAVAAALGAPELHGDLPSLKLSAAKRWRAGRRSRRP